MQFKKEIEGIAMKLPTILALPANSDRRLRQQAFMAYFASTTQSGVFPSSANSKDDNNSFPLWLQM